MKKILTTILAAALGLSAWGAVAKVGTTEYATINEAVAAWGPGKTLTLLSNVTLTETVIVEVNATKSTSNWTLDLGDYTWTADKCNAFQLYAAGGTVMNQNYGLKVYANEAGGITATGKYCIECKYDTSTAGYRPRLEIHGGTYTGSYVVYYYSSSWNNSNISNGPSTWFYKSNDGTEPVFNGNFGLFKCPIYLYAGYFNGTSFNTYPVNSTANTNIYGGHFKTLNAFPSASNNKGIVYGNYKILVKSDGSIDVTNGAPATFEASTTSYSKILTGYRATGYSGSAYFESADYAIRQYNIPIVLNSDVEATESKTISSSETLTVDMTASGAKYTGNITLSSNNAKFIVKFNDVGEADVGYYGSVVAANGKYIHIAETTENGVVTRTYSVKVNSSTASQTCEAQIGDLYYETVYDAFYAVDGNTEGKTIKLLKDVTNASILTNGKAVDGVGKTVVTFDLNGHAFTLQSAGTGNDADYTLTVIDSSEGKTGEVMNNTLSLLKIALTGDNDFSGKYTLKIQGGTWHLDPSAVSVTDETHNLVDEGYSAVSLGNGKWIVGQVTVETGDLEPDVPIEDTTTEVSYTIETVQKIGEKVLDSKEDQVISVSVSPVDIGGTKLTSVKLNDVVADSVAAMGMDAVNVTKVEILVAADAIPAGAQTVSYSVKPEAIVTVVNGTDTSTSTIELSNNDLAPGASFTFDLDVTALGVADGAWVKVIHVSSDYPEETNLYKAKTVGGKKVVTVTTSHFSTFTATPGDPEGADASLLPSVTNGVVSANCFGALTVGGTAKPAYVAVPFGAFGDGDAQIAAADIVQAAALSDGDKMYVWNGTEGGKQKYEVYTVSGGAWTAAKKVTVAADGTQTEGSVSPDAFPVASGKGVFIERANTAKPIYVYGQVLTNTVAETTFAAGLTLVSAPALKAMGEIDLNALTWTGVTALPTKTARGKTYPDWSKMAEADYLYFRNASGATIRCYYSDEKWVTENGVGSVKVPAGAAFWYYARTAGAKVEW